MKKHISKLKCLTKFYHKTIVNVFREFLKVCAFLCYYLLNNSSSYLCSICTDLIESNVTCCTVGLHITVIFK